MIHRNLLTIALLICFAATSYAADSTRPNIIYIMLDDAGYNDFGAMGSRYYRR